MDIGQAVARDAIGELELFRSLPQDALEDVRAAMRIERVAKDVLIFRQGDPVDRAYALAIGSIRIVQTGSNGGEAIVRFIGPGEMFGTVPLFTDHRFPADAVASEACIIVTWSERDLLGLMTRYPAISLNVNRILGARLVQLQERVRELTTLRSEQRIAHALLRLAAQAGRSGANGTMIEIPLRRRDLAGFAGTTLYTASRTLAAWEKAGLLASCNQRLIVRDLLAIRELAERQDD